LNDHLQGFTFDLHYYIVGKNIPFIFPKTAPLTNLPTSNVTKIAAPTPSPSPPPNYKRYGAQKIINPNKNWMLHKLFLLFQY